MAKNRSTKSDVGSNFNDPDRVILHKIPGIRRVRPEIRELYKPEPLRKRQDIWESALTNLTRKLNWNERWAVYLCAERLAVARIKKRLAERQARSKA
jgi:hypothetical protein